MSVSQDRPFLSIIIPAYNEELRLPASLHEIADFARGQSYFTEVIVVENGSDDDTSGVVERFQAEDIRAGDPFALRLMHSAPGKGAAVKVGMLAGQGDFLFICDADLSMPIAEVSKFLPPQFNYHSKDIAIASRELPDSVRYDEPGYRHLMGRVFNFIVRVLAIPGVEDTQCGFKCFTQEAAQSIFPMQTIDGWGFDIEVLYIGLRQGYDLVEVPINWYYKENSRISPIRDSVNMVLEVLRIRRNGRQGLVWGGELGAGEWVFDLHGHDNLGQVGDVVGDDGKEEAALPEEEPAEEDAGQASPDHAPESLGAVEQTEEDAEDQKQPGRRQNGGQATQQEAAEEQFLQHHHGHQGQDHPHQFLARLGHNQFDDLI